MDVAGIWRRAARGRSCLLTWSHGSLAEHAGAALERTSALHVAGQGKAHAESKMTKTIVAAAAVLVVSTAAFGKVLTSVPEAVTVTDYYKQNVYDPSDQKIGEIKDVLITSDGRIGAFVIGVGGFVGAGEKDVAVPFSDVKGTKKNDKWYLTMQANKDELKNAPGLTYDRTATRWVPEKK
jgi:sporulation protein YlmC with PRC-barrel domain